MCVGQAKPLTVHHVRENYYRTITLFMKYVKADKKTVSMENQVKIAVRNQVLMLTMFLGALRSSEVVKLAWSDLKQGKHGDHKVLSLNLGKTKADQLALNEPLLIVVQEEEALNIMGNLEMLKMRWGFKEEGIIFKQLNGSPLKSTTTSGIIRKCLDGIVPAAELSSYSSHSARRGSATTAAAAGASLEEVMGLGRWKTESSARLYIANKAQKQVSASLKLR